MSRYIVWIGIFGLLIGCKLLGVGDGSVAKEAIWAGLALINHWAYEKVLA
ncbi:hypothetical protein [Pseudomonas moorei]